MGNIFTLIIYLLSLPSYWYACLFLAILFIWYHNKSKTPSNFPPGIEGLPIIGCIFSLKGALEKRITELGKPFGEIFYIKLGPIRAIVLADYDVIQEAFCKQKNVFSGRPANDSLKRAFGGNGIFFVEGEKWLEQRHFGTSVLRDFGMGKRSMEPKILEECEFLCKNLLDNVNDSGIVDIKEPVTSAVSNIICRLIFSERLDGKSKDTKLFLLLDSVINRNKRDKREIIFFVSIFVPFMRYFIDTSRVKPRKQIAKYFIKKHMATLDENFPRDFIDCFLMEKQKGNPSFTDDQLAMYIHDLFIAGTETTANSIKWSVLFLTVYPMCLEKMKNEIERVVGTSGKISMSLYNKMHYTRAVIQETLRMRPIAPLGIVRKTMESTYLRGYKIPTNTLVIPNFWAVHHDPKYWGEDHDIFKPERHLDATGKYVHNDHVIAFSLGQRNCLGTQLARMEYFLFLCTLIQRFNFSFPEGYPTPNLDGKSGIILIPEKFDLVCVKR